MNHQPTHRNTLGIARLTGQAIASHLAAPDAAPVWAIEFTPDADPAIYTGPTIDNLDLRTIAAAAATANCTHAPDPVWSGVIMHTPWQFMRCPIEYADDPTHPDHPINHHATAFIRTIETKKCPCQWHGTMVFAHRTDQQPHNRTTPIPIPPADITTALATIEAAA